MHLLQLVFRTGYQRQGRALLQAATRRIACERPLLHVQPVTLHLLEVVDPHAHPLVAHLSHLQRDRSADAPATTCGHNKDVAQQCGPQQGYHCHTAESAASGVSADDPWRYYCQGLLKGRVTTGACTA